MAFRRVGSALILFALLLGGCGQSRQKMVQIGAILPLTGDAAVYGIPLRQGAELAVRLWNNNSLHKRKFEVKYEDSQANPPEAVTVFQRLITLDKVKVVVGPFTSSETLAIAPIANRDRVIVLSPTASAPSISNAGDFIFRITPSDNYDGGILAKFAIDSLKARVASILYVNSDYGVGVAQVFRTDFLEGGGQVPIEKAFTPGATDFRTQISEIKAHHPSVILLVGQDALGYILKQSRELGLHAVFLSTGLFENQNILKVAGQAANGVYYSYPSFRVHSRNKVVKDFVDSFKKMFGTDPGVLAAYGFDALNIVMRAYTSDNVDSIRGNLYKTKNYEGATGTMSFDKNGDVRKSFGIKRVIDGKFVWYVDSFQ